MEGTGDINHQIDKYSLVLEYADGGTLYDYLNKHFKNLDWDEKYQFALQLASAVECIHDFDIVYHDLHAKNILVYQKNIKLADFGLSKKIAEESSNASKIFGMVPFVDQKGFEQNQNYKLNKKSDVYSIGVLMWQISSGKEPFYIEGGNYDIKLVLDIINGKRKEIIDGTPTEYSNIYQDERSIMQKVVSNIKEIISLEQYDLIIIDEEENDVFIKDECSETSIDTLDIYKDLVIDSTINSMNIVKSESRISLDNQESFQSDVLDFETILQIQFFKYVIKKYDEGITFNQIKHLIEHQILQLSQTRNNLLDWLEKNQNKQQFIWLLGLLYYIDDDSFNAFELFLKAAENNYSISQVYLAKCYYHGNWTECNRKLSFVWYQKSVENGSIIEQFYLGHCYEFGIGIQKNKKKSVYWYNKETSNGNIIAKLHLANCYRLGKGIEKDEIKAFKLYESLTKQEIADAQY
ncbi:19673_t:CDS:2 [Funneliformis geosporum]|nr:19673_t:CDS:2 [Funneliformis geosporum]